MPANETLALRKQTFRIIAQDPGVRVRKKILTAQVQVPAEELGNGPWGHRVHVIDFDSSTQTLYRPFEYRRTPEGLIIDPFENADDKTLLTNPQFHQQNVYAIIMRVLGRFEFALGRRVSWGFAGHQIKVAPHAFADANAFYSKRDEAIVFGYFLGSNKKPVFTSLSHDVVAHETTHALVDGLRERYTDPSSPDQAGFHEGFSDVVALLSVFAIPDIVRLLIDMKAEENDRKAKRKSTTGDSLISMRSLTAPSLRESIIFGLAKEMGEELSEVRGQALRASATLKPSPEYYKEDEEFLEPHRRGEILVAAMLNALINVWANRLKALDPMKTGWLDRERVVEEGAEIADRLMTMSIRALDYCTPVHVEYGDFISALVTADFELHPDDSLYQFRRELVASFHAYGVEPASKGTTAEPGVWQSPEAEDRKDELNYSRTHFESMLRDTEEVFRFVWENRNALRLDKDAYTRVQSVRPCLRIAEDGFALHETVAEYVQILRLTSSEIRDLGIKVEGLPPAPQEILLYGGGVLIFDEYGRVKFHIHNRVDKYELQEKRLKALVDFGYFDRSSSFERRFSTLHRLRALDLPSYRQEGWH